MTAIQRLPRAGVLFVAVAVISLPMEPLPVKAQDAQGFMPMTDGKSLAGWRAIPEDSLSDWSVRDGTFVGLGSEDRLAYLIWERNEKVSDFEMKFSYRLPGEGNSGVEVRARPDLTGKRPLEGYHVDFGHVGIGPNVLGAWDFHFATREEPACPRGTRLVIHADGQTSRNNLANSLTASDVNKRGWNDVHIVACGNRLRFSINGKVAAEFTDHKPDRLRDGMIGLQIHDKGMAVEFKDMRIKLLSAANSAAVAGERDRD